MGARHGECPLCPRTPVNRRHLVTPAVFATSVTCNADRRPEPMPIHSFDHSADAGGPGGAVLALASHRCRHRIDRRRRLCRDCGDTAKNAGVCALWNVGRGGVAGTRRAFNMAGLSCCWRLCDSYAEAGLRVSVLYRAQRRAGCRYPVKLMPPAGPGTRYVRCPDAGAARRVLRRPSRLRPCLRGADLA